MWSQLDQQPNEVTTTMVAISDEWDHLWQQWILVVAVAKEEQNEFEVLKSKTRHAQRAGDCDYVEMM